MTAEGLTEAERDALIRAASSPHLSIAGAVERILADRLAAVLAETVSLDFATGAMAEAGHDLEMWQHRAEAAEAERDALRERVEALVRFAEYRTASSLSRDITGRPFESPVPLADLRAALDAGQ